MLLLVSLAITAYSQTGVIRELTGDVELKLSGTSAFVPARTGNQVAQDTIVSTGFRSTAIIAVGSTVITVQPLTRLSLAEISSSQDSDRLNINLQAGRIRVDVKPAAGTTANTTVRSPNATASVRGTSLKMDAMNMEVLEGKVAYEGNDGFQTLLLGGKKGAINMDGSAADPIGMAVSSLMPSAPEGYGDSGEKSGSPESPLSDGDVSFILKWD